MKTWVESAGIHVPQAFLQAIGGHPLVAEILFKRGFRDARQAQSFLDPDQYHPASPFDLPGVEQAVEILLEAVLQKQRICVWGDFDVDGQTSTTLYVSALRQLDATVSWMIPVRAQHSHGVHRDLLEQVIRQGVDLVLTCDTGVTAYAEVEYARSQGVGVIVTDHHELPEQLPLAAAVVNPRLLPAEHPLSTLPGVGVAYKLVEGLWQAAAPSAPCEQFLDLVALGIVADVAHLSGDTRYLLQSGLPILRNTPRLGLQMMMELAGLEPQWLNEEHIGYILAPRLNALGRLSDANPMIEFFTSHDPSRVRILAHELEGLNARRKLLSEQVYQGALAQIERDPSLLEFGALVLAHPAWPAGVVGIVASRLVEKFNKPAVLLSTPPGEPGRGSARSIQGIHITRAIASHQDLLLGFGGHPMAAGLSITSENIPVFRRSLSQTISQMMADAQETPALPIDGFLSLSSLELDLVMELERLAPFGAGNPPPVLVSRDLEISSATGVGKDGEHLLITVQDSEGAQKRVVYWQGSTEQLPQGRFDLAFTARASSFRGARDIQLEWIDAHQEASSAMEAMRLAAKVEIVDLRRLPDARLSVAPYLGRDDVQFWGEAVASDPIPLKNRLELEPAEQLVIWTIPPGPTELQDAFARVSPLKLVLFAVDPGMDDPGRFLPHLAGLVKHALRVRGGKVSIPRLASATAQREATVKVGIDWLQARRMVRIHEQHGEELTLHPCENEIQSHGEEIDRINNQIRALLSESAAYRRFFARAEPETLLDELK